MKKSDNMWYNYPTDEEIQEYLTGQSNCGIQSGDVVKILRKAERHEEGWPNVWVISMDKFVGTTATVKELTRHGVSLCGNKEIDGFGFPYYVLEKVEE